jgi:circadian clock protein KaiC
MKMRGADYITGRHFFEIGPDGASFYPRVTAPIHLDGTALDPAARAPIGVAGLDDLLNGGLPLQSATIVEGGTGTGKTLLGLHFVVEGARRGEPGILFTLEETPSQLRRIAANYGWDLAALEARGLLRIEYAAPLELTPDKFLDRALRVAGQAGARRAVVDSLTSLRAGVFDERRTRELTYALIRHLSGVGVTMLLTQETPELLGSSQLTGYGVSSIADNVVRLRYVEVASRLERALSVIKARGIRHSTELRRLAIGDDGARVEGPFRNLRGVLTGTPSPALESEPARPRERDN